MLSTEAMALSALPHLLPQQWWPFKGLPPTPYEQTVCALHRNLAGLEPSHGAGGR